MVAVLDFLAGAGATGAGVTGGVTSGAGISTGLDAAAGTDSAEAGRATGTAGVDALLAVAAGRTPERDSLSPPIDTRPDSRSRFSRARSDFRSAAC